MENMVTFECDINSSPKAFPHFWEHTVGSGHATLALRADWQRQLTRCSQELGFKYVRFHGILSDDMGTLVNESGKDLYSFFNADAICDFLVSIGMKPFVELSFMPLTLSSGSDIVFHYRGNITPPKNYDLWQQFIHDLIQHWVDRYGIEEVNTWFFEVWNEPNLSAFWTGSQDEYFKLYEYTATAIKNVSATLNVGGPATASNAWISEFLAFCGSKNVPVDFISTHHYPTDAFGKPGDDTIAQLTASRRSVLRDQVAEVKAKSSGKPVYYTEWSTSSNPFDELHDLSYAAAFITKTVMEASGYVSCYSYWTFSDIFEENFFSSDAFHGGFGLMNIYGIPKPSYRAYELLHRLGDTMISVDGAHDTVDVWITRSEKVIKILLTNSALPGHPIKPEHVQIRLSSVNKITDSFIERIDDDHSNATQHWKKIGTPKKLSPGQVSMLDNESSIRKEHIEVKVGHSVAIADLILPEQGVACITLEVE